MGVVIEGGKFDRRIQYEAPIETKDARGQRVVSWSAPITLCAMLRPQKALERFSLNQERAYKTSIFRIRHRSGLSEQGRITYHSQKYRILGIEEFGRKQCLDITVEALEGSGFN